MCACRALEHCFACGRARCGLRLEEDRVGVELEPAQMAQHLCRTLVTVLRIFLHSANDYLLQSSRYRGIELGGRNGAVVDMLEDDGDGCIRREGELARNHFIKHNAERIYIASRVYLAAACLLGGYVIDSTDGFVNKRE